MNLRRSLLLALLSLGISTSAVSQDLKDELDALDDFPEADLSESGGGKAGGGKAKPESAGGDELPADDLGDAPDDETPPGDTLKKDEVPTDDSLDDLEGDPAPEKKSEGELPEDDLKTDEGVGLEDEVKALDDKKTEKPVGREKPQEATTGLDVEPAARITNLVFRQLHDRVRAIITSSRPIDFSKENRAQRKQIIVEIRNASLAKAFLKRAIDTGEFDGPVAVVQAYDSRSGGVPSTKVLFQLRTMTEPKMSRSENSLYIDFPLVSGGTLFRTGNSSRTQVEIPETFLTLDAKARFVGSRISVTMKNTELSDAVKLISGYSNKNFVLGAGANGLVTLSVKNTPWDEVLAIMLVNNQLGYQKVGDVYRIVPIALLKTEIADAAKISKDAEILIPLETRLIPVNYAKATEILTNVSDFKTDGRGKISIDTRTNSLVVTDIPDVLEKIVSYVRQVDRQTAVVQIEARIVEANEDFDRSFNKNFQLGPVTNPRFAGSLFATGGDSTAGSGLRIQTTLGSLGPIDAFLGLTESNNQTRLVSSPRVTVLDNRQATITAGKTLQFPSIQTGTTVTTGATVRQELHLAVTPSVTSDGFVLMDIDLSNDTGDAKTQGVLPGQVTTDTRSAKTNLLVESGKTAVIGGVYSNHSEDNHTGLPFFQGLPILGALFKSTNGRSGGSKELVMFIQPKIINGNRTFTSFKEDIDAGETTIRAKADKASDSAGGKGDDAGLEDL